MAQVFVRVVAIVFVLGTLVSAKGFSQSIGPDGRPITVYSGVGDPTTQHPAATNPPVPAPSPRAVAPAVATVPTPPTPFASAPVAPPPPTSPLPAVAAAADVPGPSSHTATSHVLNESEIAAAIERGSRENLRAVGLTLIDVQTALLSGIACTACKQSGYTVKVFTPVKWIEFQAASAKRELKPFSMADVTPEMRQPLLRVVAEPSKAAYINGTGLAGASSVHRVVLADRNKQNLVQPLTNELGSVEDNSALRSITYSNAFATFRLADVDVIRGDDNGEFFVVVVGDNQNKYFKIKTRMFKNLF
jgi:hypothetical protein